MKLTLMLVSYLALVVGLLLIPGLAETAAAGTTSPTVAALGGARVTAAWVRSGTDVVQSPAAVVQPMAQPGNGSGWQKVMAADFEGSFPPVGWHVSDSSSTDGGQYLWNKRDCRPHLGSYSAWAGGGGADGALLACTTTYPNNLNTFLIYGPVDLSLATDAELQFALWADVEGDGPYLIDSIDWGASIDAHTYHNYATAGQTGDWIPEMINLTDVPVLGDLTGRSGIYLGWSFVSDQSNPIAYQGAFVDDAALWVYTPPLPSPPLPPATLPITRHTTVADFAAGSSPDGTVVGVQQGDGALALAAQADGVAAWERLPSLPVRLFNFRAVTAKGHLFVIGGNSPEIYVQRQVYSAPIQDDGLLGHWVAVTPLPQALLGHAAVVANDHLFVLGGYNTNGIQRTVFSAPIKDDGTLGSWATQPLLPEPLIYHAAVSTHGYIYVLGGDTSDDPLVVSATIYRARVNADGTLSAWETMPRSLPKPSQWHAGVVACDQLYILGGADATRERNAVVRAELRPDGSLGEWSDAPPLPKTLLTHAAVAAHGGILVVGGWHTGDTPVDSQRNVYWMPLDSSCTPGTWIEQPPLPFGLSYTALAATDRFVYNLGGINAATRVFASVLVAPMQLRASPVHQGTFDHRFDMGQTRLLKTLQWVEEGSGDTQISLRYRVGTASGAYGPWSTYTSTSPISINAIGRYVEYEVKFVGGSGPSDQRVSEISLQIAPLSLQYLPLVLR